MKLPFVQVDAFTAMPFRGNSAAIVFLDELGVDLAVQLDGQIASQIEARLDTVWMQALAAEMNLAETAYLSRHDDTSWNLRWFTPTVEVDLCGHATLAAAHALWTEGRSGRDQILRFQTRSGVLTARAVGDRIELDFPALLTTPEPLPDACRVALGIDELVHCAANPNRYWLIVLEREADVRALHPNFAALRDGDDTYVVTAASDNAKYDFVSRYFAPSHGIDEDPVTGSAHCILGPYWAERLGKPVVTGFQVSARTGVVECEPRGDRVLLRGDAVTVLRGEVVAHN